MCECEVKLTCREFLFVARRGKKHDIWIHDIFNANEADAACIAGLVCPLIGIRYDDIGTHRNSYHSE